MAPALAPSIFNDVLGPVMRGPSSSHSAASVRIGLLVHDLCGGTPERVEIEFDRLGSLATTHATQGADMGLFGGLLGWEADDQRLPKSAVALREAGVETSVRVSEFGDPHPNTYRLHVERKGVTHDVVAVSTGGGMIEILEIDGHGVSIFGDYDVTLLETSGAPDHLVAAVAELDDVDDVVVSQSGNGLGLLVASSQKPLDEATTSHFEAVTAVHRLRPVLPVRSRKGVQPPFVDSAELEERLEGASSTLSELAIEFECARAALTREEVIAMAQRLLSIMRGGIDIGLSGTEYEDRILGWQSGRFAEMAAAGQLLGGGLLNRMIMNVTALMEAKSAMELIVAAPTAGACATFPGALIAAIDELAVDDDTAARVLLAGGLVGVFIANRSSFAAEVGGCQAESGAGAAMAAAALVELGGGTASQSLSAASQAIQNVLGLICDPVANRVEAPCLGRNVAGAANALSCANMALAGYDHVIPLHEVLDVHRQVSEMMPRELRCTGLAGLGTTPTSLRISLKLGDGTIA